jgi:hypothetical protein
VGLHEPGERCFVASLGLLHQIERFRLPCFAGTLLLVASQARFLRNLIGFHGFTSHFLNCEAVIRSAAPHPGYESVCSMIEPRFGASHSG